MTENNKIRYIKILHIKLTMSWFSCSIIQA